MGIRLKEIQAKGLFCGLKGCGFLEGVISVLNRFRFKAGPSQRISYGYFGQIPNCKVCGRILIAWAQLNGELA